MDPGEPIDFANPLWRPSGSADAVFYLGDRLVNEKVIDNAGVRMIARVVTVVSKQEQAMRYLRPASAEWHKEHPRAHGLGTNPDLRGNLSWMPKELLAEAGKAGVQIQHQMAVECEFREQPLKIRTARWERVEEGIWCVFCV